jgi:hypothetical protein
VGTEGKVERVTLTRRRGDAEEDAENASGKSKAEGAETAETLGVRVAVAVNEKGEVSALRSDWQAEACPTIGRLKPAPPRRNPTVRKEQD